MNDEAQAYERAAIAVITAFSQLDTLIVFRKLIQEDPKQKTAEDLASAIGISETAIAEHLDRLEHVGLLRSSHDGAAVSYAVDHHNTSELWGFLMAGCYRFL
jgi:predicted transcriptional regulator